MHTLQATVGSLPVLLPRLPPPGLACGHVHLLLAGALRGPPAGLAWGLGLGGLTKRGLPGRNGGEMVWALTCGHVGLLGRLVLVLLVPVVSLALLHLGHVEVGVARLGISS